MLYYYGSYRFSRGTRKGEKMRGITERNKNAALYLRLSREDVGKVKSDYSSSIATQRMKLTRYANENGFSIIDEYIDDGWSGTNFERPGFLRMLDDIDAGRVDCVIVKDSSRLGRNYTEVGLYTEKYFPEHGVRFIAIDNGIDTSKGESEIAPFLNVLNDFYVRDLSRKVKSAYNEKFRNGEVKFVAPPFGYCFPDDPNPKKGLKRNELIIDEETAPIVREIFNLALNGMGKYAIANVLRERKVPIPRAYLFQRFGYFASTFENATEEEITKWNPETIKRIITDEMYIGTAVHYKQGTVSYKNHKKIRREESEYLKIEGAIPPIISKEDYERVQELYKSRRRQTKHDYKNLFSGMLFCPDCGCSLHVHYHKAVNPENDYVYFCCPTYSSHSRVTPHASHYIRHDVLEEEIFKQVKTVCNSVAQYESEFVVALRKKDGNADKRTTMTAELRKAERRLTQLDALLMKLYEDQLEGKLSTRNFDTMSEKYQAEQADLEKKIADLKSALATETNEAENTDRFIETVKQYTDPKELTPELLHALIQKINVGATVTDENGEKTQEIEIVWRFIGEL